MRANPACIRLGAGRSVFGPCMGVSAIGAGLTVRVGSCRCDGSSGMKRDAESERASEDWSAADSAAEEALEGRGNRPASWVSP
jgi:hypothetical protein